MADCCRFPGHGVAAVSMELTQLRAENQEMRVLCSDTRVASSDAIQIVAHFTTGWSVALRTLFTKLHLCVSWVPKSLSRFQPERVHVHVVLPARPARDRAADG